MPKIYRVPRRLYNQVKRVAERAEIHEVCYLVFGRGGKVTKFVRVPNRAEDTVMHHEILEKDTGPIRETHLAEGHWLLGLLHTHILSDAYPSKGDIEGYADGALIFILSDLKESLRAFRIRHDPPGFEEKEVVIE